MALNDYVSLTITQNTVGVTRAGFGTGLILSATAGWTERTRLYSQLSDVAVDFPVTTSAEYLAAQAYFSQSPGPQKLMIGRSANKPTLIYQLSAINPTANLNYAYQVNVKGKGITPVTLTVTSDATPTDAEYATAMVTALNGVAGKNYTAAGATSPITITATSPGDWFSIEVTDPNFQKVTQTTAEPGVAADLTAITAENPNWYGLITLYNSKPYAVAAAGYVESAGKIYVCDSNDTNTILTAVTTGELLDTIKTNAYSRTLGFYHPNAACFAGAALLGKCLPFDPGSETWAFKTLAGVPVFAMTATHRNNITSRNGNSYEPVAGVNLTFQGKTGDGNFLDVKRGLDWLQDDMSKAVFGALAGASKIPYTDSGIAVIEAQVRGSLKRATDRQILTPDPPFVVTVPVAANVSAADKAARILNNLKFTATLAGAVHSAVIQGVVSA